MSSPEKDRYLTDEYRRKSEQITPAGRDPTETERLFLKYCEELRRFLRERTPVDVIRRAAWQRTERTLQREDAEGAGADD